MRVRLIGCVGLVAALLGAGCAADSDAPAAAAAEERVPPAPGSKAFQDCPDCPVMIAIPAGSYTMGEPEADSQGRKFGWGGPPIEVEIAEPFALGQTEVTIGQFAAFVQATGYQPDGRCRSIWEWKLPPGMIPTWRDPKWPDGSTVDDGHPAVCLGHGDAEAYVAWLNQQANGRRRYALPTEAQWEYAARAGTTSRRYWDPDATLPIERACAHANLGDRRYKAAIPEFPFVDCDDGHAFTAPVASFPANAFGLHDMLGNAWEWVADCGSPDLSEHPRDGSALSSGDRADCSKRVLRGAGFPSGEFYLRVTTRGGDPVPDTRLVVMGFRVAATLD